MSPERQYLMYRVKKIVDNFPKREIAGRIADLIEENYVVEGEGSVPVVDPRYIDKISDLVIDYYKINRDAFFAHTRKSEVVRARQIFMYLAMRTTSMGCTAIGNKLGFDHTSVIYAREKIKGLIEMYPDVRAQVNYLLSQL